MGHHALLGLRFGQAAVQGIHQQSGPEYGQACPQPVGCVIRVDGHLHAGVDPTGVKALGHGHQADTGHLVAGQQGPFHRSGPPPPGQQGEVQVHHRYLPQHLHTYDPAEGDHHAKVGTAAGHRIQVVGHGEAQVCGQGAHRGGGWSRTPPTTPLGRRHDQHHLVARIVQRGQRRYGHLGVPQVHQPPGMRRRRRDQGNRRPPSDGPPAGEVARRDMVISRRVRLASRRRSSSRWSIRRIPSRWSISC